MSDNLPDKRRHINSLTPVERADTAHKMSMAWAEGATMSDLSNQYNLSVDAVKKLISEHAAYIRNARPDTKSLQEEEYRRFYGEMKRIQPEDQAYPALVRSTAIQARMQILTRLDKVLGHETAGTMEGAVNTIQDLIKRAHAAGQMDASPIDLGRVGVQEFEDYEDVEDAEVIDDGTE